MTLYQITNYLAPLLEREGTFARFLDEALGEDSAYAALRRAETIGRPIGDPTWLEALEARTGRTPAPERHGPRPRKGI